MEAGPGREPFRLGVPEAERILLVVQEQRGIISTSPRPGLVIAVLQESKLIQSPDGALDLPLFL